MADIEDKGTKRKSAIALYEKTIAAADALTSASIRDSATAKLIAATDLPDRLVVFVGSGASMAYGQIGWGTLVDNVVDRVKSFRDEHKVDRVHAAELADLWQTLDGIELGRSAENKILAFELAGRIVEILAEDGAAELVMDFKGEEKRIHSLKDIIALETSGWENSYWDRNETIARAMKENLRTSEIDSGAFRSEVVLNQIKEIAKKCITSIRDECFGFYDQYNEWIQKFGNGSPIFIHQDLSMAAIYFSTIGIKLDNNDEKIDATIAADIDDRSKKASPTSRDYGLRCLHDPIRSLITSLNAKRFITTNYDREIEGYFERIGYAFDWPDRAGKPSAAVISGKDGTGSTVRSAVLTVDSVADLAEFAANAGKDDIDVFHLHGRNDLPDTIIATERDYQHVYLRSDRHNQLFDEALDMVFRANVVLFVGLGMAEADLLRPLRKFLSERPEDRPSDSLIVLMPRTSINETEEAQRQLGLKVRYGVDTIVFGEDDLATVLERISALRRVLQARNTEPLDAGLGDLETEKWPGLEAHIDALNRLTRLFQATPGEGEASLERFQRIHGWSTANNDAGNGLNRLLHQFIDATAARVATAALCTFLAKFSEQNRHDFRLRRRRPMPRNSNFPFPEPAVVRHGVVETGIAKRSKGLFFKLAQDRFEALRRTMISVPTCWPTIVRAGEQPRQRRRIFVVSGERGTGRGRLFWRLHDRDNLENRLLESGERYAFAFSATTSFSWEFASTFDKLIDFLRDGDDELRNKREPRSARLEAALGRARKTWTSETDRHLFVLNGIDTLLDRDGNPFGDEYAELFRILLGPKAADVPLDIILLMQTCEPARSFLKGCLRGLNDGAESKAEEDLLAVFDKRHGDAAGGRGDDAWSQARNAYEQKIDRWLDGPIEIDATDTTAEDIADKIDERAKAAAILCLALKPVEIPREYDDIPEGQREFADNSMRFLVGYESGGKGPGLEDEAVPFAWPSTMDFGSSYLSGDSDAENRSVRCYRSIRRFRDAIHNTFAWSLVEQAIAWLSAPRPDNKPPPDKMEGILPINAVRWLDNLTYRLERLDVTKRPVACLNAVIDFYESHQKPHFSRLRSSILKHLTIIGVPVEETVLFKCPELAELAEELIESEHREPGDRPRNEVISNELAHLVDLRLVFQLDEERRPFGSGAEDPTEKPPRFAVHRLTQTAVLRRMGCPRVEGGETNFFQVTLYAAQPKDLPSLNIESYDFICRLIETLIQEAPEPLPEGDEGSSDADKTRLYSSIQQAARCHRAAFGAVRASWSLAVVSRLLEETNDKSAAGRGLLDAYRQRNLALIDRAKAADLAYESLDIMDRFPGHEPVRAHYADEIVWLYNELGVTALTQGHPLEALPLFDRAVEANRAIEHSRENATWARVGLNAANAMIEAGELRHARELLDQISTYERRRAELIGKDKETSLVAILANAFLALIDHLSGRLQEADREYKKAIEKLSRFERYRSVAIFCRHRSTLKAREGDAKMAKSLISRAVRAAQAGRHQDIVHLARVNQCVLEIKSDDPTVEADAWMRSAERYADYMGIPKLKVELLFNRGRVFLERGETKIASECATKALAIASHHGMKLRKIAALMLLGEVTLERGNRDSARQILISAQRLAEDVGYYLKGETAHQILLRSGLHPQRQLKEL